MTEEIVNFELNVITDLKKIRWLEENTIPISTLVPDSILKTEKTIVQKLQDLTKWEFRLSLSISYTQRVLKDKLSKLLGHKWAYCVNYEYQNAIWGFTFGPREKGVLIYFSKEGTHFQAEFDMLPYETIKLIEVLYDKLFNTSIKTKKTKKIETDEEKVEQKTSTTTKKTINNTDKAEKKVISKKQPIVKVKEKKSVKPIKSTKTPVELPKKSGRIIKNNETKKTSLPKKQTETKKSRNKNK